MQKIKKVKQAFLQIYSSLIDSFSDVLEGETLQQKTEDFNKRFYNDLICEGLEELATETNGYQEDKEDLLSGFCDFLLFKAGEEEFGSKKALAFAQKLLAK